MRLISLLPMFLSAATIQAAAVVNIAFTDDPITYTGPAVVGDAGDAWVQVNTIDGSPFDLGSGLSVAVTGDDDTFYPTGVVFGGLGDILEDYVYAGGTLTVTIGGLNPSSSYDIYPIASLDGYFDGSAKSVTATGLNMVNAAMTGLSSTTSFAEGVNYVALTSVTPTAGGQITITMGSDVGLNAIQVAIPEPSTYVLAVSAFLALLVARRKK